MGLRDEVTDRDGDGDMGWSYETGTETETGSLTETETGTRTETENETMTDVDSGISNSLLRLPHRDERQHTVLSLEMERDGRGA